MTYDISRQVVPDQRVLSIRDRIAQAELPAFLGRSFGELFSHLRLPGPRFAGFPEEPGQPPMRDGLRALLLDQEIRLGDDAEHGAVAVDHGQATDPVVDQQLGHFLQRRLGTNADHRLGHDVANGCHHHVDHLSLHDKDRREGRGTDRVEGPVLVGRGGPLGPPGGPTRRASFGSGAQRARTAASTIGISRMVR